MTTVSEEAALKITRVREWLQGSRASAVVLSSQVNFAWLTGGGRSHISLGEASGIASVVITSGEAVVVTTNIEAERLVREELPRDVFVVREWPWHEAGEAERLVGEACDLSGAVSDVGAFGLPPAGEGFVNLRLALLEPELERYRRLGQDAASCVEGVCKSVKSGQTEHAIAGQVAARCFDLDILPLVVLIAADRRIAAYRHPLPTSNRYEKILMVVLSARRHGLHISLTRMVSAEPPERDLIRRHLAAAAVDARLILESRPGSTLGRVFQAGQDQYAREGFADEWRLHHQGGLTGYAGREIFAGPETGHVLQADQVVAWNPSVTGAKSEDTVLVTDGVPEVLSRTGDWPETEIEADAGTLPRPAILQAAG